MYGVDALRTCSPFGARHTAELRNSALSNRCIWPSSALAMSLFILPFKQSDWRDLGFYLLQGPREPRIDFLYFFLKPLTTFSGCLGGLRYSELHCRYNTCTYAHYQPGRRVSTICHSCFVALQSDHKQKRLMLRTFNVGSWFLDYFFFDLFFLSKKCFWGIFDFFGIWVDSPAWSPHSFRIWLKRIK